MWEGTTNPVVTPADRVHPNFPKFSSQCQDPLTVLIDAATSRTCQRATGHPISATLQVRHCPLWRLESCQHAKVGSSDTHIRLSEGLAHAGSDPVNGLRSRSHRRMRGRIPSTIV